MTGFGTGWIDYDNDGRLDLFVTNGAVNIIEGQRGQPVPYRQHSQLFHNEGGGRFRDVSREAGPFFDRLLVGRGVAFGDLDNDGDVDMVVTTNNGPAVVLLNQTIARRPSGAARWTLDRDRAAQPGWQPRDHGRSHRRDARRPAHAVAAREDRRQLPVGERRPRARRARRPAADRRASSSSGRTASLSPSPAWMPTASRRSGEGRDAPETGGR